MLDIKPGIHVGQFRLGMSISETIQYLQHYIRQQNQLFSGFDTSGNTLQTNINPLTNSSSSSTIVSGLSSESNRHHRNTTNINSNTSNSSNNSLNLSSIPLKTASGEDITSRQSQSALLMNKIEILYDGKNPLRADIVLKLVDDEIVLRFESRTQRLKFIEVNNVNRVSMAYSGTKFSGITDEEATFVKIYQVFGPTYPGFFEKSTCTYYLSYPGITFVFPIPLAYANLFDPQKSGDGTGGSNNRTDDVNNGNTSNNREHIMPMEFPDGTTPIATHVYVYNGHDFRNPNLPQDFDHDSFADTIARYVNVIVGKGITVHNDLAASSEHKSISFYDTTQDVLMALGAPNNIYYKKHDKLRIHATKPKKSRTENENTNVGHSDSLSVTADDAASKELTAVDYFYNYFSLGFDIMFNGQTHMVQKIILHTNFPGSKDFNIYVKCNFRILTNQFQNTEEKTYITADTKFSQIQKLLHSEPLSKPLVNDATSASNPFGGTRFYAYPNCIFEIMKNDHINSVVLFASKQ